MQMLEHMQPLILEQYPLPTHYKQFLAVVSFAIEKLNEQLF